MRPALVWVLGDAAGIGSELVAKSLASEERSSTLPGKGIANPGAFQEAVRLTVRMVVGRDGG